MAGDAGGVLEVEAVVGDAALGSAGTGALFTTSADMVRSEPHWMSGQSVGGGGRITQTAAPCSGSSEVNRADDSLTPTHGFLVICLEQKK